MARNFYRMLFWICTTQLKVIQNVQLHAHACLHVQNSHFCCLKTISVFDLKLFLRKFILGSINITYTKTVILDPKTIKIVWVCRSLIGHKSKIMIWLFWRSPGLRLPAKLQQKCVCVSVCVCVWFRVYVCLYVCFW